MTAEVHRLTGAGPVIEPNAEIITEIERLLVEARAGEIKGIGYFIVDGGDTVTTKLIGGCASANDMVSGAARLNYRLLKADDA
jgi:hypothetical protein